METIIKNLILITCVGLLLSKPKVSYSNTLFYKIYDYPGDSSIYRWNQDKQFVFSRFTISLDANFSNFKFKGSTESTLKTIYPNHYDVFDKISGPYKYSIVRKISFPYIFSYRINRKYRIEFGALPKIKMNYDGAFGENANMSFWFIIPWDDYEVIKGVSVKQEITSQRNFHLSLNYIMLPFKQRKNIGIEVSSGLGVYSGQYKIETEVQTFDTNITYGASISGYEYTATGDSYVNFIRDVRNFEDKKRAFGVTLNIRGDIYLSRFFSFNTQMIFGSELSNITTNEINFTQKRITAYVPEQKIRTQGICVKAGVAFHFIQCKK